MLPVGCVAGFVAGPVALKFCGGCRKYLLAITLIGLLLGALAFGVMFLVGNPLSSGPGMEATLPWGHASGLLLGFSAALGLGYACCKDCIGTGSVPPQV